MTRAAVVPPDFIVGIGGSSGGLEAYVSFLQAVRPDTGMTFVIVCHLLPTASCHLAEILSRHTKMSVTVPSNGDPIRANQVYVIPPNADLLIESGNFKVVSPRTINKPNHTQIDLFLTSLAQAMGSHAIGIIFSGYDGDGTEGCKQIKARGGTTFAQDISAEIDSMPVSARASGCVDFILPPGKIPEELQKISLRVR